MEPMAKIPHRDWVTLDDDKDVLLHRKAEPTYDSEDYSIADRVRKDCLVVYAATLAAYITMTCSTLYVACLQDETAMHSYGGRAEGRYDMTNQGTVDVSRPCC